MKISPSDNPGRAHSSGNDRQSLPAGIWVLGLVSMFMDTSSELVQSLLPVFMTTVLGASMMTIGMLEGLAEATASVTKVFSGAISDYLGKRKFPVVLGYGLSAFTKPSFHSPVQSAGCLQHALQTVSARESGMHPEMRLSQNWQQRNHGEQPMVYASLSIRQEHLQDHSLHSRLWHCLQTTSKRYSG
jgi:hypothetical protein